MARWLSWLAALHVLSLPLAAQSLEVSPEDQQIWLVWVDGRREPLTHGPEFASAPTWSQDHERIAYFRFCPQVGQCEPKLVLCDPNGAVLKEFSLAPTKDWDGCNSVNRIDFIDRRRLGVDCHVSPSLSEYSELDQESGQALRHWLGFGFAWSPDNSHLAYHGWIPHFSPPFGHSSYLQIDGKTVYPPHAVTSAVSSPGPHGTRLEPHTIQESGGLYRNIHEFYGAFFWAPDSKRVAFIDRIYDWKSVDNTLMDAGEQNVRFFLVIAGEGIKPSVLPVSDGCNSRLQIEWRNDREINVACDGKVQHCVIDFMGTLSTH